MIKAGVIGWPVSHSLSPRLHGYWLRHYKIEGEYNAYPVEPSGLKEFLRGMAAKGLAGCNLTLPHKEVVLPMLDEVDDTARAIGAVNTIVIKNGKLHGSNTDAFGFAENIRPHIAGKNKAVILGAGGAARAVGKALYDLGYKHIIITNRTEGKAAAIARPLGVASVSWDARGICLKDADLLVNTTSLGMEGKDALDMDLSLLPTTALVTDIVYTPLITPLLAAAKARGNPTVDGLGMLLYQAMPGFAAWFGTTPEVTPELRDYMISGL